MSISQLEQLTTQITELTRAFNQLLQRNTNLEREVAALQGAPRNDTLELYKIPDPIKSLQTYTGEKNHLNQWLNAAESTLQLFATVTPQQYRVYLQAVLNKIEGKAKNIICLAGEIQTFEEVKTILRNALRDRQEISYYKNQLWQTRMSEDTTIHKNYATMKATVQTSRTWRSRTPSTTEAGRQLINSLMKTPWQPSYQD